MKKPIRQRYKVMLAFLTNEISKRQAANILGCTTRTIENYKKALRERGKAGLIDHRHGNHRKLTVGIELTQPHF